MRRTLRSSITAALAATLALTAFNLSPAQAAPAKKPQAQAAATVDLNARQRRHYRRGNDQAALQMFGIIAGTIAGIAAAEESRRYYRRGYGYDGGYGYRYAPPPDYGYGPYYRY